MRTVIQPSKHLTLNKLCYNTAFRFVEPLPLPRSGNDHYKILADEICITLKPDWGCGPITNSSRSNIAIASLTTGTLYVVPITTAEKLFVKILDAQVIGTERD